MSEVVAPDKLFRDVKQKLHTDQEPRGSQLLRAVEIDQPIAPHFVEWQHFWDRDHVECEYLFEPVFPKGRGCSLYSRAKEGKSVFVLGVSFELATGPLPVVVVYFDHEMTEADLYERLVDMGAGPETDLSRFKYALLPSLPPLDTAAGGDALFEILDGVQAEWPDHHLFVVFDTYSRVVAGTENDSDTTRDFYRHVGLGLKQRGWTWVRLDHEGKDASRGSRGSSAKTDDVDVAWRLQRTDNGLVLQRHAARMNWVPERVAFERHDNPLRFVAATNAWPTGTRELADALAELAVPTTATVKQSRAALKAAGRTAGTSLLSAAVKYRRLRGTPDGTPPTRGVGTSGGTDATNGQQQRGTPDGTDWNASHSPFWNVPPP